MAQVSDDASVRWVELRCGATRPLTLSGGQENTHVEEYEKLKQLVEDVSEDIYKAMGGNKAAGTRVRKSMQEIKNAAQDVRKKVLDLRGADEEASS